MKYLFLAIVFLSCSITAYSQSFIGKSPMRSPSDYEKPKFSTQTGKSNSSRNVWAVWADRDGITSSNGKQLDFTHRFIVVEENADKIHIVDENGSYNSSTDEFISEPIDYGWVPKSSMLLWSTAMYSDRTNFRVKAMTIITPSLMKDELARIKSEGKKMNFFSNPETTIENNNELPLFEIFYVFKKEGTRLLLGRRDDISKGNAGYYLMGWVDESKVQLWETRQALEPDWDKIASEERRQNKIPAALFETSSKALNYGNTGDTTRNFWSGDRFESQYDPYWKRLPVLSQTDNLIETAVVTDLVNKTGKTVNSESLRKLQVLQSDLREKRRNINIVFVIEGTENMAPYFKAVQMSLRNSTRTLYNADNRFKFGAVVYRDYDNPSYDKCYNTIPLINNSDLFGARLLACYTSDPACSNNTPSKGLYLGLDKAKNLFSGKEKESNIIILIGQVADRSGNGRITRNDVIPGLIKNRINLLAVQVNHGKDQPFEDFLGELPDMILKCSMQLVEEQEKTYGNQKALAASVKPRWNNETSEDIVISSLENSPLTGGLQYVSAGKSISMTKTSKIIEKMIIDINERTNTLIRTVDNLVNSITVIDPTEMGTYSPAVKLFLKDAGYSNEQIALLTQKNYQFLLKAYTSFEVQKLKNPIYKSDIFLDAKELNDLIVTLTKIYTSGLTGYQRRQGFRDTLNDEMITNYGVKGNEIKRKSFSEIMNLITGLPSPNAILKNYTFNDIPDINRFPDTEFDQILGIIKDKCELLTKIAGNKQFYFMSNDRPYYWIPQSYLP
jgi:hypothetical protein